MANLCFLCQKPAPEGSFCPLCYPDGSESPTLDGSRVWFCQESHLKVHQMNSKCGKFYMDWREGIGNCMFANQDIQAGEVILAEDAAMSGPNRPQQQAFPSCLECTRKVKNDFRCHQCQFPVCNAECSSGPNHRVECPVFAQLDETPDFSGPCEEYSAVIPLRILALKDTNPELWERVNLLMDHTGDMNEVDKALWTTMAEDLIHRRCKLTKYSKDELFRAAGIFLTNGVNQGLNQGHGLYPTFSFISHSCVSNSRFQIHQGRRLVLRAQVDIAQGEEITTRYLPAMVGNIRRRFKIRHNWNFDCTCPRCQDPTELGTCIGITACLKCVQNKAPLDPSTQAMLEQASNESLPTVSSQNETQSDGEKPSLATLFATLLAKKKQEDANKALNSPALDTNRGYLIPSEPLEYLSSHVCHLCGYTVNGLTIFGLTKNLEEEADEFKTMDPVEIETKLQQWLKVLHRNHYLILKLKKRLVDILSLMPDPEDPEELKTKMEKIIQLGEDMLQVVEVLEPGYSLPRGRLLRQLHVPRITVAKLKLQNHEIDKAEFLKVTAQAIRSMKLAVKCLETFGDSEEASLELQ